MALQRLRDFYQVTNSNTFNEMLKQKVIVTEKIASTSFHVRRGMEGFEYFKSGNTEPMTMVDRTLTSLYEVGIKHFQSLVKDVKEDMPTDWKFGFDYLPETNISSRIQYDQTPFNFMILSHIQVMTSTGKVKKVLTDPVILKEWANKLQVQAPTIIFEGNLDQLQKQALVNLLSTSNESYQKRFTNESFTKHIYKLFNPSAYKSVLNEDLEKPIDGLVISFIDSTQIKSFKLDELAEQPEEARESSHMYQLTMVDILEYFSNYKLDSIELVETAADKRYIELVSTMFNSYVKENATKYIGVNFNSADFSKSEMFQLNTKWIQNETTLRYIENPILGELYKIVLGSFNKKKVKESTIMNQTMIEQLNEIIDQIDAKIYAEQTDENAIYQFNHFLLKNKIAGAKTDLNEALKIDYPEQGKEKVNIFVGRFQPFTTGHVKVLETLYKQNGYPVIVFLVKAKTAKKEDAIKRPYDVDTQIEMFNAVQREYKFLKQVIVVPSAAIDVMFNELRPKYEPVLWGTGTDRMKAYGYMVNNDKYRDELGVLPEFKLYEIQRGDDDVSATKVRKALEDGDIKEFNKMTPSSLHSMFNELKAKLEKSLATVESIQIETSTDTILTFEQFKQIQK